MDQSDLEILFRDLESERVERKESMTASDKIAQAICAFANDLADTKLPGVLFIGVDDKGRCKNLSVNDELLKNLGGIRSDGNILPLPVMSVYKATIGGCELAVVEVQPAQAPPVRYKGQTWIRVGPRRGIASVDEERRLSEKRRYKDPSFDLWGVPDAKIENLNLTFFHEVYLPAAIDAETLKENRRSLQDQLRSLRFLRLESETPTVAGLLVLGKMSLDFIPGAYIQFLRLAGDTLADPIRSENTVRGNIYDILRQVEDLLKLHISSSVSFTDSPREVRRADYPLSALVQIVRNAVMHRSYQDTNAPVRIYWFEDRIEIHSPGGPYGQVNKSNFGRPGITDYRNPQISAAMKDLGLIQRFGAGIAIARQELEKNGNPPLEFEVENSFIAAIVRRAQ